LRREKEGRCRKLPKPLKQTFFLQAPPSRVFKALTEQELLLKWFLTKAKLEPRAGGEYRFEWNSGYSLKGRISRYRKNKSLAYTFGSEDDIVSFELSRRGRGTLLSLRDGLTDNDSLASRAGHWAYYLTNLKSVLENGKDLRSELDWEGID
jgi:uncharacterized protein YndB with AHSA1/START domain